MHRTRDSVSPRVPKTSIGGLGGGSLSHASASGAALAMIGGSLSRATALIAPGIGGGHGSFVIGGGPGGGLVAGPGGTFGASPATARALQALQAGSRAGLTSLLLQQQQQQQQQQAQQQQQQQQQGLGGAR